MPEFSPFSAETAASVARARQHSLGDLLGRTALRFPDELAVVDGDRRATFAELDATRRMETASIGAPHAWRGQELEA